MIQRVREAIRRHVYLTVSLLTILLIIILGGVATACFGRPKPRPYPPHHRPRHVVQKPIEPTDDEDVLGDTYTPPVDPPTPEPPTYPFPEPEPEPVPLPVPIDPIMPPPIHIDPPITIDPPYPYPLPCGGCGAVTQTKHVICPMMQNQVRAEVCRLDL